VTEGKLVVACDSQQRKEWVYKEYGGEFRDKEINVNLMVMVFWIYTFFKTDKIVHFKYVWFIILQLYLNKLVK
jgi:hypothetical protein